MKAIIVSRCENILRHGERGREMTVFFLRGIIITATAECGVPPSSRGRKQVINRVCLAYRNFLRLYTGSPIQKE